MINKRVRPTVGSFLQFDGVCEEGSLRLAFAELELPDGAATGPCRVMIRPEDLILTTNGSAQVHARVTSLQFLGRQVRLVLDCGGQRLVMDAPADAALEPDAEVALRVRVDRVVVFKQ